MVGNALHKVVRHRLNLKYPVLFGFEVSLSYMVVTMVCP